MTDVIRPANGQTAGARSARNAWQVPQRTAGYDDASGERNLMAPESGEASAWSMRPGAASPAGWLLPADGEAAPPFRHGMEPVRSDDAVAAAGAHDDGANGRGANGGEQDGDWYIDPQPTSQQPLRAVWSFQNGSRHIPVVGPTEALRGRAGGPGMAVPAGAVPGLLDPRERSGWQLAQDVWQESGVVWELPGPDPYGTEFPGTGIGQRELADFQPAAVRESVRAWLNDADPVDPDPVDPGAVDPELANSELADLEPASAESGDEWFDDQPAVSEAGPVDPEPANPGPADPAPAPAESAGTWFDGPGPADPRLAARRSVGDRPTVVELTRASFADSGVIAMEPEFPSAAIPRQPTFTPADSARLPLRDRVQQGSVRYDDVQAAPRSAPARPYRRPPEPMAEDPELQDRIQFGPDRAGRARRPSAGWNEYQAGEFTGQAWSAGRGQVPLGAPVMVDAPAPSAAGPAGFAGPAVPPRGGGAPPLGEPDELFRAWQGSVREAAAPRRPWAAPRPGTSSRRRRAVQVAKIGVPAAVIVTVGAGALLMLTGKANEMLAPQSNTGAAPPAAPASPAGPAATASIAPSGKGTPPAFAGATLAGYPGQRGAVTVASMQLVGGVTLAVGGADGHPAIWRRAASGTWTLESAARLAAVAGRASLASVAYGQAGWIAVGATADGGTTQPVVLSSADGVTWQPVSTLAALAGKGTEFLGIAAGRGGYVVVGRQMTGGRIFAVLWYSADLRSWTMDSNGGLDGRLTASTVNAVAATADGFVAVGSHGAGQAIWTSPDGKNWNPIGVNLPAGSRSATLSSVAASGGRVVAAGYADTPAGDVPVVLASVDGGAHWRQGVLTAPGGLGVITALTATPSGFTAAGQAGKPGSAHTVTWTSQDGLTWSRPTQTTDSEITALAAAGTAVIGTSERGATPTVVTLPLP
jgi:hypothetical protein